MDNTNIKRNIIIVVNLLHVLVYCTDGSYNTCLTPSCNNTVHEILQRVNLSVDPCEDFYEFACGNFVKNAKIAEGRSTSDSFSIISDEVLEEMRKLLEEPLEKSDFKPFALVKTYYQVCKNKTIANELSVAHIKRVFKDVGGWPVLDGDSWNETQFDWTIYAQKMYKMGLNKIGMFVNFELNFDKKNSSLITLNINQVSIDSEKVLRSGFNDSIVTAYYDYAVKISVACGAKNETAIKEMKEVIELEIAIARILVPPEERRDLYQEINKMSIRELEQNIPFIAWLDYFNSLFSPTVNLTYDEEVNVNIPDFYHKIKELISSTPKRTIANYMFWQILEPFLQYTNDDLLEIQLEFQKVYVGITENVPRWKRCLDKTIDDMQIATAALYLKRLFAQSTKEDISEIINAIRKHFRKNLVTLDWMDDRTKQNALDKADAMSVVAAYPDELGSFEKVEDYYKDYDFDSKDFFGILLHTQQHVIKRDLEDYQTKVVNRKEWRFRSDIVKTNAYYWSSFNEILIVAGILRGIFFDPSRPKYMNYGAIGTVVGHEITHGFDDKGRQYDKDGGLNSWWENVTEKMFAEKAQCLIDQYGNTTVPELNMTLNGINTQGENIADHGGIKFAYAAYKQWIEKHGPEEILQNLSYTPEQLFWISHGNMWCQKVTVEQLKISVLDDTHAPSRYRVNTPLMNSADFANDFACSLGSPMNPVQKCSVW